MNNLLKVELNKMQTKIVPLQNSEMLLITGGASLNGGADETSWCLINNVIVCGSKLLKANKGDELELKVSF